MQPVFVTVAVPTFLIAYGARGFVNSLQRPAESRVEPHASGETFLWRHVECQRGDYLPTLDWLRERQASLRREGYRVRRTTFHARGSRWVSRIVYVREPGLGSSSAIGQ